MASYALFLAAGARLRENARMYKRLLELSSRVYKGTLGKLQKQNSRTTRRSTDEAAASLPSEKTGLYARIVIAVAIGGIGIWGVRALSDVSALSGIRPALLAALPFAVEKNLGTVPSVSSERVIIATGVVGALEEVEVLSPVSSRVVSVSVATENGIQAGEAIMRLDDTEVRRKLRDASLELANAKLELERLGAPSTSDAGTQSGEATVALADAFTNMPWLVDETGDILYGYDLDGERVNISFLADKAEAFPETARYRDTVASAYETTSELYRKTRLNYQALNSADPAALTAMLQETEILLQAIVRSLVSAQTFFTFVRDHYSSSQIPLRVIELHEDINERAKTASDNLQAIHAVIASASTPASAPVSEIDRRDAALRVEAAANALVDAEADIPIYTVRSPVSGRIASLDAYQGKPVVQGEILARIASPQHVARVPLKEAEVPLIRLGQKAEVTFDGIPGLVLGGEIIKVDSEATVVNNTVTFYAYIGFPTGESRPKPGMTATAKIAL